jgi:hypothetical protein
MTRVCSVISNGVRARTTPTVSLVIAGTGVVPSSASHSVSSP